MSALSPSQNEAERLREAARRALSEAPADGMDDWFAELNAALADADAAADRAALAVPQAAEPVKVAEGMVLVPREATDAMIQAGADAKEAWGSVSPIYRAMIAAAPAIEAPAPVSVLAAVENARGVLEAARDDLAGEPEYHESGMGCGLEDRGITDRYEAMAHGWSQAMERVYSENIAWAKDNISHAIATLDASLSASAVEEK